ncbi:MAG: redox-regulated ATPase YchF [Patescibacteria group bacterium]|nr:redox-regulated ATPase YchF [Patescibacteria group bacterium]MCL5093657.1 redox-regulated ATPase YchF [Patescibacteria group bacterium]
MSLSIGIIGLPNVGKSTLFNALTKSKVDAKNYPFCTIDPNIGIVPVPDERLEKLAKAVNTEKIIPAVVEFVDIAGLVKGANKGEGLGNKFLAHIRECDAIVEVIRDFSDTNVIHIEGKIDPENDILTIKTELILADLETMEKTVGRLEKEAKGNPKVKDELELAKKVKETLEKGEPARDLELKKEEKETSKSFQLLTAKPHIYVLNVDENHLTENLPIYSSSEPKANREVKEFSTSSNNNFPTSLKISAKIESELSDLPEEEVKEYLKEIGQEEPGLHALIRESYKLLGLQTYFTAGEKEAKAWTIPVGAKAPEAAGVIHTDFEKGFIKADCINWEDLVESGGWAKARELGKIRLEGKDYVVEDGDVMIFKFNN